MNFMLVQDNDSHWYVIEERQRAEWNKWRDIPVGDERGWEPPKWAKAVGGSPSLVKFPDFVIE